MDVVLSVTHIALTYGTAVIELAVPWELVNRSRWGHYGESMEIL